MDKLLDLLYSLPEKTVIVGSVIWMSILTIIIICEIVGLIVSCKRSKKNSTKHKEGK